MSDRGVKAGQWARRAVAMGLGLLALTLVTGSLGNLSRTLNGTLAVAALLMLAFVLPHRSVWATPWQRAGALVIMLLSLPFVARGGALGLSGAALFFFALSLLVSDEVLGSASALLLTAFLFAIYRVLLAHLPALWYAEQWMSLSFSGLVGVGLKLGPEALGMLPLVLFGCFAFSTFLLSVARGAGTVPTLSEEASGRRWTAVIILVAWLLGLVLSLAAYIWTQPPLGSWVLTHWPAPVMLSPAIESVPTLTYLDSLPLLFALMWLVSALASLGLVPQSLALRPPTGSGRWLGAGLGLLALATLLLTLNPPLRPRRGMVLFYDAGQLDWGRPVFGRYGPRSGGTFGLWPDYLALYGYGARTGPLTTENLEAAQVVVLVNLPVDLSAEEKERLLAFVERGGGLIIWGEHTGLVGIREPVNDILRQLPGNPIHLRFDSAVPTRQGWAEGLTLSPHPALYEVQDPIDLVIAIGASLDITPPARPIIVGRFGHSDQGDATNQVRNYVGDMRYRPGEPLGDLVLAAEVQHGLGRVVVLGDTTPLGSVNLMTNMPVHARLLDWVTAAPLLAGAGFCLFVGRSRLALFGAVLVLGLSLVLTSQVNRLQSEPPLPTGPIAYVDLSHQERFDRMLWEETSIGGLGHNLVRNRTVPLLLRELDAGALDGADVLVIIAPGQPFAPAEAELVRHWVEAGGSLLVSVGFEESEASRDLLAAFGLAVEHIPLGPVEAQRDTGTVRFHEAWPVRASGEQAQTIVEGYGYPLAVYQPWGQGGVVLIGDSAFLLGGTLEGEGGYEEGNILLLRDMLQGYLEIGGGP
jgi:hypothetical protein